MNRRHFIRSAALLGATAAVSACGGTPAPTPTPIIKEVTKVVEKVVTPTPDPRSVMPKEIVFMDSASGASFQLWFQDIIIPAAQKALGFKINYIVGRDAEVVERMKAWKAGEGDIDILFPKSTASLITGGVIPLEPLTVDKVPNIAIIDPVFKYTEGVEIGNKGAPYFFGATALIYDSKYIKKPPTSWAEWYDRRQEFKGKMGLLRPDAKSSAGWYQPYIFVNAFYDFSKWDAADPAFLKVWDKAKDFYTYATLPMAPEPTNCFENFMAGDTWLTFYAIDFALWSARQGTMPPTIKAQFLKEGSHTGSPMCMVIPANIPEGHKKASYQFLNYILSEDSQVRLTTTMWQYPTAKITDKLPPIVWENIPKLEDALAAGIPAARVNAKAIEWVKAHGMELAPK